MLTVIYMFNLVNLNDNDFCALEIKVQSILHFCDQMDGACTTAHM